MPEPRVEVGELWRSVNREIHEHFRQAFRGSDLPFGVLFLLRHVDRQPGVTVSELARQAGIVKSHVSKMMEQLFRQGYVEKRADQADQRLVRVYVTQSGRRSMAEMEACAQDAWSSVMDEVPEARMEDVVRGLRILLSALEKSNGKMNKESQPSEH